MKSISNPAHHIPEPSSPPLPQLPPKLWKSSALWKTWPLQSDWCWRGLWRPVDQQAQSERLSGASSRGQGPSSRALATVLWHLTLQVFIFLERASLWKIRIIHWFWHTLLSRPTTEALFLIYVKFSDQIKINLFWGCFFYKIAFLQECYWSRKSIYHFQWLHHRKHWI